MRVTRPSSTVAIRGQALPPQSLPQNTGTDATVVSSLPREQGLRMGHWRQRIAREEKTAPPLAMGCANQAGQPPGLLPLSRHLTDTV